MPNDMTPGLRQVFYTNRIGVGGTPTDTNIQFAIRATDLDGAEEEGLVVVYMSWEQALVLREMVAKSIESYERSFGPVRDLTQEVVKAPERELDATDEPETGSVSQPQK
jgi:hypothetical protein